MIKTAAEFEADAARVYEKARDEGKAIAVLTIAAALLDAYAAGSEEVFSAQQLAHTPPASEQEM